MPSWLERAASLRPDRVAVEVPDGALTYAELLERTRAATPAASLEAAPTLAFVAGVHAGLLRGSPVAILDPRRPASGPAAAAARPEAALTVFTSGTTGEPRPVGLRASMIEAQARGTWEALGLGDDERWLCPLPLSHVGGLMVVLRSAVHGTTAVLRPVDALPGCTLVSLVPTQLSRLLDAGIAPPSSLRAVLLGGAGAPRPLLERAAAAGWPVAQTYGLTQACSSVTISEPGDVDTQGAPLPGIEVRIAPDGEIVVSGPTVAGGGPLRTGDLGALDAWGRLVVTGRKADTIVTGGENVAPAQVEAVLLEHPDVADAAVFGRADPEWGEAVHARVVSRDRAAPPDPAVLRAFARERLPGFATPKSIELVAGPLPRNAGGKLLRRELP